MMRGSRLLRRVARDESGMAMALAVIMVALFSVMGAGLLVFATTDLGIVVESNQGQRAFEMADAGAGAAKRQLDSQGGASLYDGVGTVGAGSESQWSWKTNGATNGVTLNGLDTNGDVAVTIQNCAVSGSGCETLTDAATSFKVISTGQSSPARRKIETIIKTNPGLTFDAPSSFFTQSDFITNGAVSLQTSAFALGNVDITGGAGALESVNDAAFGRWAATSGSGPYPNSFGSYPNSYNATPRDTSLVGIGTLGELKMSPSSTGTVAAGTRSFGNTYDPKCPTCKRVVQDYYNPGAISDSQKIALPFKFPTAAEDAALINALKNRALQLEIQNPGKTYLYDATPGNGQADGPRTSNFTFSLASGFDWPSGSADDTVVFFDLSPTTGSTVRTVTWNIPKTSVSCTNTSRRGILVVNNGAFEYNDNASGFNGGVFVRGSGATPRGTFTSKGGACMNGYANTSGNIDLRGSTRFEDIPNVNSLPALTPGGGGTTVQSWRELYN